MIAVEERAVQLVLEHLDGYSLLTAAAAAVAAQERLGTDTARRWVLQAQVDAGAGAGVTSEENEQIK